MPAMNGTGELTKSNMSLGRRGMNADAHLYGSSSSNNVVEHAVTSSDVSPTSNTDRSKSSSFNRISSPESLMRRNNVDRPHSPDTSGRGRGRDILLNPVVDKSMTKRRCGLLTNENSLRGCIIRLCNLVNDNFDCSAERIACLCWSFARISFSLDEAIFKDFSSSCKCGIRGKIIKYECKDAIDFNK